MQTTIKQNNMQKPLQKLLPVFREKLEERGFRSLRAFALFVLTERGEATDSLSLDRATARLHPYVTGRTEPTVTTALWLADITGISVERIAQAFNEVKKEKGSQSPSDSSILSPCSTSDAKRMYNLHFLTEAS